MAVELDYAMAGRAAFRADWPIDRNPYPANTLARREWCMGWLEERAAQMNAIDGPNAAAEHAATIWGPTLTDARAHIENEFPKVIWELVGCELPNSSIICTLRNLNNGDRVSESAIEPAWAMCLALETARALGWYAPVPPAPKVQPETPDHG